MRKLVLLSAFGMVVSNISTPKPFEGNSIISLGTAANAAQKKFAPLRHRKQIIRDIDTNNDRQLSEDEIVNHVTETYNSRDLDGDGTVTLSEVLSGVSQNFSSLDTNGDGVLQRSEIKNGKFRKLLGPNKAEQEESIEDENLEEAEVL